MKQSHIVSPIRRTTPFLPTLPIEVSLYAPTPLVTWSLADDEEDCLFQCQLLHGDHRREFRSLRGRARVEAVLADHRREYRSFRGMEYVKGVLAIDTPQELVSFMNIYASPIDRVIVQDVDGKLHWKAVPFRWNQFLETRIRIKNVMCLPIEKLLRHPELQFFFDLDELQITATRRGREYYGVVGFEATLENCYRVIAYERQLANAKYGFCDRCDHPFEVTSGHNRKFCENPNCGHAFAQRAYRERKNRERLKKKLPY